jgi:hypothetical protein
MRTEPEYGVPVYSKQLLIGYVKTWTSHHIGIVRVEHPNMGIWMLPRVCFSGEYKCYGLCPWSETGEYVAWQEVPPIPQENAPVRPS